MRMGDYLWKTEAKMASVTPISHEPTVSDPYWGAKPKFRLRVLGNEEIPKGRTVFTSYCFY